MKAYYFIFFLLFNLACSESEKIEEEMEQIDEIDNNTEGAFALVENVSVSGEENSYTFNVTLRSPDLGCDQYADWWEIFDDEEELEYRRILTHSHVNEQPFARSGGPVMISKDKKIYIRGHMNNTGYSRQVWSGSVATGFVETERTVSIDLEKTDPQPDGCDF